MLGKLDFLSPSLGSSQLNSLQATVSQAHKATNVPKHTSSLLALVLEFSSLVANSNRVG